jgi:hypothetical protein
LTWPADNQVMEFPLAVTAALFAVLAIAEWRRLPVIARIYLGAATAFAIGAITYPGMSIVDVIDRSRDGLTYVLGAARIVAFAAVLVSVTTFLRERALGSD